MYKTGLVRILFNFEAKNKHDLFLHYYNVGKLISIASNVKEHLFIELVNYNNPNFDRSLNSPTQHIQSIKSSELNDKVGKLYNDLFFSWSEIDKKVKLETSELDDPESPSTIVKSNIEPLKRLENLFFNYYQILYNENPKLNVSIIPLKLLNNNNIKDIKRDHLKYIKTPIDALFLDNSMNSVDQQKEIDSINSDLQTPIKTIDINTISNDFSYPKHFYDQSLVNEDDDDDNNCLSKWRSPFKGVVLGGTFDRMHPGHKVMLTMASLLCSEYMEVGVTDNSILKTKKYSELIAPFQDRSEKTFNFLNLINPNVNYNMLKLIEPYANTMISKKLECIVISPETFKTAIKINQVRRETNLKPLEIYSISYFDTLHQGDDVKLSSTYLRELDYKEMNNKKE